MSGRAECQTTPLLSLDFHPLFWPFWKVGWDPFVRHFYSLGRQLVPKVMLYVFVTFPFLAWAAWQLQYSPTACENHRQFFTKPSEQVAAPRLYKIITFYKFIFLSWFRSIYSESWKEIFPFGGRETLGWRCPWLKGY